MELRYRIKCCHFYDDLKIRYLRNDCGTHRPEMDIADVTFGTTARDTDTYLWVKGQKGKLTIFQLLVPQFYGTVPSRYMNFRYVFDPCLTDDSLWTTVGMPNIVTILFKFINAVLLFYLSYF